MRNRLASVALCLLLSMSVAAQKKKTDREHEGLFGPVKMMRVEVARLSNKDGQVTEDRRAVLREAAFSEDGMLVEEIIRDRNDGRLVKHIYGPLKDDSRRELRVKPGYTPVDSYPNAMLTSRQFQYDNEGNRTEEKFFFEAALAYTNVFTYQPDGKRKDASQYGADGQLVRKYVYIYDARGYISERSTYNQDGGLDGRESYSYADFDSDGNWVKRITSVWNEKKSAFQPKEVTYRTISYWGGVSSPPPEVKPVNPASRQPDALQGKASPNQSSEYPGGAALVRVQPKYSLAGRNVGGTVVIKVTIDEAGSVVTAKVIKLTIRKPNTMTEADARHYGEELEKASLDAAMQWKFKPVTVNGSPAKVVGSITFNFHQ